jgi:ribosomal protein L12E/L44/L45/RPP1/RPP2
MTNFTDALNVTLSGWTKAGGVKLEASDITAITNFLQAQDFDGFLSNLLANNPASLAASEARAANAIPIVYSGSDVKVAMKKRGRYP